jgi:hypothetical protein
MHLSIPIIAVPVLFYMAFGLNTGLRGLSRISETIDVEVHIPGAGEAFVDLAITIVVYQVADLGRGRVQRFVLVIAVASIRDRIFRLQAAGRGSILIPIAVGIKVWIPGLIGKLVRITVLAIQVIIHIGLGLNTLDELHGRIAEPIPVLVPVPADRESGIIWRTVFAIKGPIPVRIAWSLHLDLAGRQEQ